MVLEEREKILWHILQVVRIDRIPSLIVHLFAEVNCSECELAWLLVFRLVRMILFVGFETNIKLLFSRSVRNH